MNELIQKVLGYVSDSPLLACSELVALVVLVATLVLAIRRRPRKAGSHGEAKYFENGKLLRPPLSRPAYSDRMAYVLAEMSALAYYQFEGQGRVLHDYARQFLQKTLSDEKAVEELLEQFAKKLLLDGVDNREFFEAILKKAGFELLATIDVAGSEGFACRRAVAGEPPYVVVAFRGTEKKVSDWLTDARAIPTVDGATRVHTGFHEAFLVQTDGRGMTVAQHVENVLADARAKGADGAPLPVFFAGHSLGGALAMMAVRNLARDISGACYTFGGPRIANYEYFRRVKTPVFRVINSSDIVPRVPPGAIVPLFVRIAQALSWLTKWLGPVSRLFDKLEELLDKLNGYRHFGDVRYLTDVGEGRFSDVQLLPNPPAIDRVLWFWHNVRTSLWIPLKSHGLDLYRKKLNEIASRRNS